MAACHGRGLGPQVKTCLDLGCKVVKLGSFFDSVIGDEVSQDAFSNAIKAFELKTNKMDVTSFLDTLAKTKFWKIAGLNVDE